MGMLQNLLDDEGLGAIEFLLQLQDFDFENNIRPLESTFSTLFRFFHVDVRLSSPSRRRFLT